MSNLEGFTALSLFRSHVGLHCCKWKVTSLEMLDDVEEEVKGAELHENVPAFG